MKGMNSHSTPRNKGQFLWDQMYNAVSSGAEMIYVAMFDEMDEGTAIFKCATKVPIGESVFVPIEEGLSSDHYLWLVGQGKKMLKNPKGFSSELPVRK